MALVFTLLVWFDLVITVDELHAKNLVRTKTNVFLVYPILGARCLETTARKETAQILTNRRYQIGKRMTRNATT